MPHFSLGYRTNPTLAAEHFKSWWKSLLEDNVTIFLDGSEQYKFGQRGVGYGFAIYRRAQKVLDGLGTINSVSHVFDAEAVGA
jgi:hypothetical protein